MCDENPLDVGLEFLQRLGDLVAELIRHRIAVLVCRPNEHLSVCTHGFLLVSQIYEPMTVSYTHLTLPTNREV